MGDRQTLPLPHQELFTAHRFSRGIPPRKSWCSMQDHAELWIRFTPPCGTHLLP